MNEEPECGGRVGDKQDDVDEVQQVVEKLDEVVGGHRRQQHVVRRHL